MTFNLIQSINVQRPFLGIELLTKTMGSLRFGHGQWHRGLFFTKNFCRKTEFNWDFCRNSTNYGWFGGKLRRLLRPLPRQCRSCLNGKKLFLQKRRLFFRKKTSHENNGKRNVSRKGNVGTYDFFFFHFLVQR